MRPTRGHLRAAHGTSRRLTHRVQGAHLLTMTEARAEPATIARALIRAATRASLGTRMPDGAPYVSLVLVACAPDARPLIFVSSLAEHTKNLARDARASLLFDGTAGLASPLTGPRVSVQGRFSPCDAEDLRARYFARHPDAAAYAGFADFRLFRLTIERAHLVAGFGAIDWIPADALLGPAADALAAAEPEIIRHMNEDHAAAVALYARTLLGLDGDGWLMTGIDPDGADLRRQGDTARLRFGQPITSPEQARTTLAALAQQARARVR